VAASAEALCQNRSLQMQLRHALSRMSQAEQSCSSQADALQSFVKGQSVRWNLPRVREASFFSDPKDAKSTPPKNLDGVRHSLFRERYHAVGNSPRYWQASEEAALQE
ncbi:unnamed protein product, partial [Polarella glacialis]